MNTVNLPDDVYLVARLAATAAGEPVAAWVAGAIRYRAQADLPATANQGATGTRYLADATPQALPLSLPFAHAATKALPGRRGAVPRLRPGSAAGATYVRLVLPVALEVAAELGERLSRDALIEGIRSRGVPCGGRNRAAIYARVRRDIEGKRQVIGANDGRPIR